jgi:hypothetical protein
MELILAGVGMVACMALMMMLIPLAGRLRRRHHRGQRVDTPSRS